ncbi:glutamine amidotransferase-related protein [Escherichia coli]
MAQAFGGKLCARQRSCTAKPLRLHITVRAYSGAGKSTYRNRYHSLVVEPDSLPARFDVTAWSETRDYGDSPSPVGLEGVQFHPENILSQQRTSVTAG